MTTRGFTHESSRADASPEWYTPPTVFEAMPGVRFDLDPCSPVDGPVPWVPADRHLTVHDDGLRSPWAPDEYVWMNPPYGRATGRWLARLSAHGNGMALVFARTDTAWFHQHVTRADVVVFLRGRLRFWQRDPATGRYGPGGTPGTGSMLVAYGARAANDVQSFTWAANGPEGLPYGRAVSFA